MLLCVVFVFGVCVAGVWYVKFRDPARSRVAPLDGFLVDQKGKMDTPASFSAWSHDAVGGRAGTPQITMPPVSYVEAEPTELPDNPSQSMVLEDASRSPSPSRRASRVSRSASPSPRSMGSPSPRNRGSRSPSHSPRRGSLPFSRPSPSRGGADPTKMYLESPLPSPHPFTGGFTG